MKELLKELLDEKLLNELAEQVKAAVDGGTKVDISISGEYTARVALVWNGTELCTFDPGNEAFYKVTKIVRAAVNNMPTPIKRYTLLEVTKALNRQPIKG